MIRNSTPQVIVSTALIDTALLEFQELLLSQLPWLDAAYGKAELRREKDAKGRVKRYPVIYVGTNKGKEYETLMPDEHKGNFSFFKIEDGESYQRNNISNAERTAKFRLIFWFDYRKVYPLSWKNRTIEHIKKLVYHAVENNTFTYSTVRLGVAWQEAENIYRGYTDMELDNQFHMRPFGGLAVEGTIRYFADQTCINGQTPQSGQDEFTNDYDEGFTNPD